MSIDINKIIALRKELHTHPEVSGKEFETAQRIKAFIEACNPDVILEGLGGTGIVASWSGKEPGPEILFRAELDALPIHEINEFAHKSKNRGVSHKCGHDGHSAILCGLAQLLSSRGVPKGKVHLLFQPSEEDGTGAEAMLADKRFDIKPDFVFALHNIPSYPTNTIIVKEGSFSAAVKSIIIHLKGKTSHAAEPENGINPAKAMAEILQKSLAEGLNKPERDDMKIVTPVYVNLGEKAYGTSAGEASIHLTLRCWTNEYLYSLEKRIEDFSRNIASKEKLQVSFEYTESFMANINDKDCVDIVRHIARSNKMPLEERRFPFKWGEDFGSLTSRFKGCMFGLGAGTSCPALHNPDYDFPDELVESGIAFFYGIIKKIHNDHV